MMCDEVANMFKTLLSAIYLVTFLFSHVNGQPKDCPIGFNSVSDSLECYKFKGPETFSEKYEECDGNQYSHNFLQNMHNLLRNVSVPLWTDYVSFYPGGVLVDKTDGSVYTNVSVSGKYNTRNVGIMCMVVHIVEGRLIYKEEDCNSKHYRFCVVSSYFLNDMQFSHKSGCGNGFIRFTSPLSRCLTAIEGVHGGTVRANWKQAQKMCNERNATLIQKGWRYANNPYLYKNHTNEVPLGVFVSSNKTIFWSQPDGNNRTVPFNEHNIDLQEIPVDSTFGSLNGNTWDVVDQTKLFFNVICEKQAASMTGLEAEFIKGVHELQFQVKNQDEYDSDMIIIECMSDSEPVPNNITSEYTLRTEFVHRSNGNYFKKNPRNGYYYCSAKHRFMNIIDTGLKSYLYIERLEDVRNTYAIKIKSKNKYEFDNLHIMEKVWMRMLSKYMFLLSMSNFTEANLYDDDMKFKLQDKLKSIGHVADAPQNVYRKSEIKRVYLDRQTAVLHVEVMPNIRKLLPIHWESIEVLSMKPVYVCSVDYDDEYYEIILGQTINVTECKTFRCVGDFNEGVDIVEEGCDPRSIQIDTEIDVSSEEIPSTVLPTSTSDDVPTTVYTITETLLPSTTEILLSTTETDFPTAISSTTAEVPITVTPPPRPPQQQVDDVLNHLSDLLKQDPTEPISLRQVNQAFEKVDELLSLEADVEIPSDFLNMLDSIGARADLNGTSNITTVRSHVAMVVAQAEPETPIRGLRIASRAQEDFQSEAFHILSERNDEEHLQTELNEAVVFLPESVAMSDRRVSFVVFRDDRPFLLAPGIQHYSVNSRVVSIRVEDVDHFENGEVVDIHLRPMDTELDRNQTRSCGFWDFRDNGTGMWSQTGCVFIKATSEGLLDTCRCTHLTHFAEVLVPRAQFPPKHERALEILSVTGCSLSLFGLSVIAFTALLFRAWRKEFTNKIWLNLCVAICLLIVAFFVIVFARFEEYNLLCMFTGILLHYSVVCSFCWMSIAAVISYKRLVQVFSRDVTHKLLRACAFAYGTPFLIIGILLSVDPHAYSGQFQETNPTGAFCYPTDLALWLTVYTPVVIMLLVNSVLFILIVRSVFAAKQIRAHGDTSDAFRCASVAFLLVFLFGLPWLFGLFAHLLVFSYLHTLTATFQGFVLFLFFIVGNKKTRELWMNKLRIKQTRKVPVSSSTGQRGQTVTIETNTNKPLSLSADESRFS